MNPGELTPIKALFTGGFDNDIKKTKRQQDNKNVCFAVAAFYGGIEKSVIINAANQADSFDIRTLFEGRRVVHLYRCSNHEVFFGDNLRLGHVNSGPDLFLVTVSP